jgi:trehalose/maltose hydrolase-like predicted phosphorylase
MTNWNINYNKWNPAKHPMQEALCTLGNGYFATRGAMEQCKANKFNYPGTYLAGGYNRAISKIKGRKIENEDLVNWPNWLYLTFKIGDSEWLNINEVEVLDYAVNLNLKEGMLERKMRIRDNEDRESLIISKRIVSMDDLHVAGIEWTFIPQNWSGEITLRTGIDGNVRNRGVERYNDLNGNHLDVLENGAFGDYGIFLVSQTRQSKIVMAQASSLKIYMNEDEIKNNPKTVSNKNSVFQEIKINCSKLQPFRFEKLLSVFTSKDFAISDPLNEAKSKIKQLESFSYIYKKHRLAWAQIWEFSNMTVKTEGDEIKILRLHIFHIYQTISKNSIGYDIGIPSRGWHGEAYRGHVFWDELYIFPYLNLHMPQLARSLLMYRYHRLPKAREAAKKNGYDGAMYPWQSGSNGREESQKIHLNPKSGRWVPDNSNLQRHINAAIPYNVWLYYQTTGDMDFFATYGAEIILSTALFWSGIAELNLKTSRFEINGVMGPDEYHTGYPESDQPGLNNNAYTNLMAVWVIQRALEILEMFDEKQKKQLADKVGFNNKTIVLWKEITTKMYIPFIENNIIMQFDGFDQLKDLDWVKYRKKYGEVLRLDRILEKEGDSPNYYKASKQADVLMLFYLFSSDELVNLFDQLGYNFNPESIPENIKYYQKITAHGSTLSQVIHSWVLARSDREGSWQNFEKALLSDIKDLQGGTTSEGIHLGAMAGTVDIIQRCYTGLEIRDNVLWLNPRLPREIEEMKFHIRYRTHWIKLRINHKKLWINFYKNFANPVEINVCGKSKIFKTNDSAEFDLKAHRS